MRARLPLPRFSRDEFLQLLESRTLSARAARLGLGAASALYGAAVAVRNLGFDRQWSISHRSAVPVVSVGNLTLGGTGKTPTVEWVSRWFRARGVRVAILSRGYGREGSVNDEALALEENLPDVPHLQDPDRVRIAGIAVHELESQVLVLDDGFQHRRLARDLDLVLLDALEPFGFGRLVPRGMLREPLGSLRRADVAMITQADMVSESTLQTIRDRAERAAGRSLRWVLARKAPIELIGGSAGPEPTGLPRDSAVAAFCGIGNPDGFRKTVESLGLGLLSFRTFPDHHLYNAADVADLTAWAREAGAVLVLTTQKDLVKLRVESLGASPLRALRISLEIIEGGAILDDALSRLLPAAAEP
jgi:tetraacyldisaccharide 4'-kinase